MNIDEMQPGPELDTLIEEVVFKRVPCDKWVKSSTVDASGGRMFIKTVRCEHDGCYPANNPMDFSTRIAPAWEVHNGMVNRRFSIRRLYFKALTEILQPIASARYTVGWPELIRWFNPYTICLAALKAVEALEAS